MATVGRVVLTIDRTDADRATVTVDYSVHFSAFDIASDLEYAVAVRLVDDHEDGGFDQRLGGPGARVRAEGRRQVDLTYTKALALPSTDLTGAADSARAVVELTPLLPTPTSRESTTVAVPDADPSTDLGRCGESVRADR